MTDLTDAERDIVVDGRTGLAQRWCALQIVHDRIDAHIERALQPVHGLSVREYSLLEVLARQHDGDGGHLQMKEVAGSVGLSQSATTRLVARLEDRKLLSRFICPTDRRGIYTEVTAHGRAVLDAARPTNARALHEALDLLGDNPEFSPLVEVLRTDSAPPSR